MMARAGTPQVGISVFILAQLNFRSRGYGNYRPKKTRQNKLRPDVLSIQSNSFLLSETTHLCRSIRHGVLDGSGKCRQRQCQYHRF